jgi:hypothetical protein
MFEGGRTEMAHRIKYRTTFWEQGTRAPVCDLFCGGLWGELDAHPQIFQSWPILCLSEQLTPELYGIVITTHIYIC